MSLPAGHSSVRSEQGTCHFSTRDNLSEESSYLIVTVSYNVEIMQVNSIKIWPQPEVPPSHKNLLGALV